MGTPISWIEGQARGKVIGLRRTLRLVHPGQRAFTKARQRLDYAYRVMRTAMQAQQHIEDCHREIERRGGVIPAWPKSG